jgi:lipopolysaccharide transport system permease protein
MYQTKVPLADEVEGVQATTFQLAQTITVEIGPRTAWWDLGLKDLWDYRELTYFLIWRDVKVRYKQTVLGVAWAILQPLLNALVFSIVFGRLAKLPSDGIPYPVFTFAALVPWQFFAGALSQSSGSMVSSQNLITKVYFPRLAIPLAAVLGGLVDFCIAFAVLIGLMFYYHIMPSSSMFLVPLFVLLAVVTALSVGIWLSALNVQFRDVRYAIPFLVQFWMFATPVAYSTSLVPAKWRAWYGLNPMAGVIDGFRSGVLGKAQSYNGMLWVSIAAVIVLLLAGLVYFRRMEETFADIV